MSLIQKKKKKIIKMEKRAQAIKESRSEVPQPTPTLQVEASVMSLLSTRSVSKFNVTVSGNENCEEGSGDEEEECGAANSETDAETVRKPASVLEDFDYHDFDYLLMNYTHSQTCAVCGRFREVLELQENKKYAEADSLMEQILTEEHELVEKGQGDASADLSEEPSVMTVK